MFIDRADDWPGSPSWPVVERGFAPDTLPAGDNGGPCYLSLSDRIDCYAILDRCDYEWARSLGSGLWCHTYGSGDIDPETGIISRPKNIYARKCIGKRTIFLHREVTRRAFGPPTLLNMVSDHKNGETLDCRRANLHWVTRSYNAINIAGSTLRERLIREVELSA